MQKLVSIITVVFNGESVLEKTIQSIINKKTEWIEYVVLDGASTDKTLEIIKCYASDIDVFKSENDNGIYDAMNKAVSLASGKYVLFLNAGDTLQYNFNDILIFKNDFSFIYGNVSLINPKGDFLYTIKSPILNLESFFSKMPICHQTIFYNAKYLKPYNLNYKIIADRVETFRLFQINSNVKYIDEIIAEYPIGGENHKQYGRHMEEERNFLASLFKQKYLSYYQYQKLVLITKLKNALFNTPIVGFYRWFKYR